MARTLAQPGAVARPARARARGLAVPATLIAAALGSGAIYGAYVAFVAYLPRHVETPSIYLLDILGWRASSRVLYAAAVVALWVAAAAAWRVVRVASPTAALRVWAVAPPILFAVLLTFSQPLFSCDLFHYIFEGRILGNHASNPYLHAPAAFPNDPFFVYSNWKTYASPYGPLWVLPAAGLTLLAGDSILWSVLLFKVVALAGYLAGGALLWDLLRRLGRSPRVALAGLVLWLWNPLVLIDLIGNGHNDVVMLALVLLGFWLYQRGRPGLGIVALTAAALVKYAALVLLPLVLWHRLRTRPGWRARAWEAARLLWAPAGLVVGLLAPFWIGPRTLGFLRESGHYYSSVAHVVRIGLEWFLSPLWAEHVVQGLLALVLLAVYPWLVREAGRDTEGLLAGAYHAVLLLLVLWTFFVPWYATWAIPFAAALGTRRAARQVLVLSGVALLSYVIQFHPRGGKTSGVEPTSALSALLIFLPLFLMLVPWHRLRQIRPGRATLSTREG